jgi:phosphate transport system permease protein
MTSKELYKEPPANRSIGWMGLKRGHKARPLEWVVEKLVFAVSLSAIVVIFLIFAFVGREALPILFGQVDVSKSATDKIVQPGQMDTLSPKELQTYLNLTDAEFKKADKDTLTLLMEVKAEEALERKPDKDSGRNSASWRNMLLPHQWTGYDKPEYIWQPVSSIPKFNMVPLIVGSLKATLMALMIGVPLALFAAIYVSQLASPRLKEYLKPSVELLAGIPSVVLGFFALIVMASVLQNVFGYQSRLNAFVAGIALSLSVIPVVFSIAEDALTSVPRSYTQAALALGSSRWQAAWQVVLPAALPGVFAAVMLGFGRAIGETMVVLMASGNASIMSWSLLDSTRTITATLAAEMGETVFGGAHYRVLFLIGSLLFVVTFLSNLMADIVIHRLKNKLEGKTR